MTREYLAVNTNRGTWARGDSPVAAYQAVARMYGPRAPKADVQTFAMPLGATDSFVDQMGYMRWTWADGADTTGTVQDVPTVTR